MQVKTKDNAGEWTTTIRSVIFDNASPTTDLLSLLPANNTFWKDPVIISGTSTDNLNTSFVDLYFKESSTSNPWTNLTTLINSITSSIFDWSYSWDPSSSPGEGIYDLAISATDTAGNQESLKTFAQDTAYVPSLFPIISNQKGITPSFGEINISWTTQIPTSGRVVYDTTSHPSADLSHPNYGYTFSSGSINLSPKTTSHTLFLTGLSNSTTYYYRIISTSSPTTVDQELTNKTLSSAGPGEELTSGSPPATITQTPVKDFSPDFSPVSVRMHSPGVRSVEQNKAPKTTETNQVLGQTTKKEPKTWMLILSIFLSVSYLAYLLSRRR